MFHKHAIQTEDGWRLQVLEATSPAAPIGPPLLCIHGFSQSHLTYTSGGFAQNLAAQGIPTYTLDLRGHGGSAREYQSKPYPADFDYGWDTSSFFQYDIPAALQLLEELHPDQPAVLCGHSMGGVLSVATTLRVPERIAGLVLLAAPLNAKNIGLHIRYAGLLAAGLHHKVPLLGKRWKTLPMRGFFKFLDGAYHKVRPGMSTILPLLLRYDQKQVWPQIWHPKLTSEEVVREMLQTSYPETMGVVKDIMRWSATGRIEIGRPQPMNYTAHFHRITQPVVAAWGERDILALPHTGDDFLRTIRSRFQQRIVLPDTRHIDITAGEPSITVQNAILQMYRHQF